LARLRQTRRLVAISSADEGAQEHAGAGAGLAHLAHGKPLVSLPITVVVLSVTSFDTTAGVGPRDAELDGSRDAELGAGVQPRVGDIDGVGAGEGERCEDNGPSFQDEATRNR